MPVTATPQSDDSSVFLLETDVKNARYGEHVYLTLMDRTAPSATYTLEIRRRRTVDTRNPLTDPVVATAAVGLDADGFAKEYWIPQEGDAKFVGPKWRYYGRAVNINDANRWVTTPLSCDIRVSDRLYGLIEQVDRMLGPVQAVPVYHLRSRDNGMEPRYDFRFTYGNWRQDPEYPVVITLTTEYSQQIQRNNYTVDYDAGSVLFNEIIDDTNEVDASFTMQLVTDTDIRYFLEQTLQEMNFSPPYTQFTLTSMPLQWDPYVVCGATAKALRQVMLGTIFRERLLIYSDATQAQGLVNYADKLTEAYEQARTKKTRWSFAAPRGITGYDMIAPPRVTGQNYQSMAFMRGRAF
jgi:hypothetical protein